MRSIDVFLAGPPRLFRSYGFRDLRKWGKFGLDYARKKCQKRENQHIGAQKHLKMTKRGKKHLKYDKTWFKIQYKRVLLLKNTIFGQNYEVLYWFLFIFFQYLRILWTFFQFFIDFLIKFVRFYWNFSLFRTIK